MKKCFVFTFSFILSLFPEQHWGRVRAYGRRRGYVQSVPHPSQEPEDSGCRRGDHPPESRHKAWDLVRSDHQLLDQGFKSQICKGEEGFRLNFRFYVLVRETVGSGLGQRDPSSVCGGQTLAWGDSGTEGGHDLIICVWIFLLGGVKGVQGLVLAILLWGREHI